MPRVSVILTSYNHAKYIKETIDSILNQTFEDFELIIVDDNSSDRSWEIIQSYDDERIISFKTERENSIVEGMIKSIQQIAKGEYIAIHHSDDVWELTKLEKQVKFLDEHGEYGAVFTNALPIDEDSNPFTNENHFYYSIFEQPNRTRHEWLNYFFYIGNALCHPSVLIKKECYYECGVIRYGLAQLGDFDMWIRLCMNYNIYVLPEKLTKFRVRDNEANSSGNTPTNRKRTMNELFFILEEFFKIEKIDEIVQIFPESSKYVIDGQYDTEYILAMVAIDKRCRNDIQLHGLNMLYKLINDEKKSKKIKELYGFDYQKLVSISCEYDIFGILTKQELEQTKQELEQTKANLEIKEQELLGVYSSRSWKLTRPLRKIMRVLKRNK